MAILVLVTSSFVEQQRAALATLAPGERIHTDPARAPPAEIEALLAFKLAPGIAPRHLAEAALDVFETEPLPATSPLWRHPKILCTPHIAATPRAEVAARQFLDNLRRARDGKPLLNVVDRIRGY